MATEIGSAALAIIPSFDGIQAKLERGITGPGAIAGTRAGAIIGDRAGTSAGRSFGAKFTSLAKYGILGAAGAITAATAAALKLSSDAIGEAEESQRVGALTAQVIETTGKAAGISARQVGDLASALSLKSGVDDEVIQRGANLLLTFTNIRNEAGKGNAVFDQAVKITQDLAASMAGSNTGLDLKGSAILVGKALNDPAAGLTALTRVGVSFTEQQKDQIKALIENGERMKAQKIILGELNKEFGGSANAQATLGEKVDTAWGNVQERLGYALLPLLHDFQRFMLREGIPTFEHYVDVFQDRGVPAIEGFVRKAKPAVEDFLPKLADAFGTVRDTVSDLAPMVKGVLDGIDDLPPWVKELAVGGGATLAVGRKLGLTGPGGLAGLASAGLGGRFGGAVPVYVVNGGPGGAMGGAMGGGVGGKGVGAAVTRGGVALGGAILGADLLTRALGWKRAGATEVERRDAYEKTYGQELFSGLDDARSSLFKMTGVNPGAGPFGLGTNSKGLAEALYGMDPGRLFNLNKQLIDQFGLGFRELEKYGDLPDGFTRFYRGAQNSAHGVEALTSLLGEGKRKADDLATGLDDAGRKVIKPKVDISDIGRGKSALRDLFLAGVHVDGQQTRINIDTSRIEYALAQLEALGNKMHAINTAADTNELPYLSGGGTSSRGSGKNARSNVTVNVDGRDMRGYVEDIITQNRGLG